MVDAKDGKLFSGKNMLPLVELPGKPGFTYDTPEFYVNERTQERGVRWHATPQEIITQQVARKITEDREGKFRRALIDLGWTPPYEDEPHEGSD